MTNVLTLELKPENLLKREDNRITFTEEDSRWVHYPYNNPSVVTGQIAIIKVHRTLVNNNSSIDILYLDALKKMRLNVKNLRPMKTLIFRFTGDNIDPLGMIKLVLTMGESWQNVWSWTACWASTQLLGVLLLRNYEQ